MNLARLRTLLVGLLAMAALWGLPAMASAASLTLTQLPGAKPPEQLYLLSSDQPLAGAAQQIKVTENGQPVQDLQVKPSGTVGSTQFGTVLMIDTSASMRGRGLNQALAAARQFLGQRAASQPAGIVFFNSGATVGVPMTTDGSKLSAALASPPPVRIGTKIFDAASTALSMLHGSGVASGLIVLLSDGRDTGSRQTESKLAGAAAAAGVRVYSIGVQDSSFDGATLQSLASATHGAYEPSSSPNLLSLFHQLGSEPANQYTISYTSVIGQGHPVNVDVTVPGAGSVTAAYTASRTALPAQPPTPTVITPAHPSFFQTTAGAIVASIVFALLIGLIVTLVIGRRGDVLRRVGGYMAPAHQRSQDQKSFVERALGDKQARKIAKSPFLTRLRVELEVAEINLTVDKLALFAVLLTALVGWLLVTETGSVIAAPLAILVPFVLNFAIRMRADRKRRLFSEQLPDNLQVVASAMRAGTTFVGALKTVIEDAPEPSKRELKRAITDEALGVPLAEALSQVTERMKSEDFQHVAVVASLQRDTGGNTAEVVDLVADTIRERIEIRRMVRALTAQGRLAGFVLSGLPVGLLLMISLINPNYTHPLFHTTPGLIAMGVGVALSGTGSLVIRRIVDIKI
jgi:tight adherence protein B